MKIEKLKSGSYRIRKMYKGVTYTIVTDYKPTQKEALRLLADEMDKAQSGKYHISFTTAAEKYIKIKKNVLSPSTIRGYKSITNNLSNKFMKKIITDITAADIQAEINIYTVGRSTKSVHNAHGFISAVMGMFCPNTTINTTLPQKRKNDDYIPSDDDVRRILNYARGTDYEVALILATFGLRRSEICALTLDDIKGCILSVNKAKVQGADGEWHIKTTKTADGTRDVYLPDEIVSLIQERGKIYSRHPNSILKFLQKAQKDLEIPSFSLHKLRHYYASVSHSLGIPDSYIMAAGGWKSDSTLKTVYRHAMDSKKEEMQEFAGEYIKEIIFDNK